MNYMLLLFIFIEIFIRFGSSDRISKRIYFSVKNYSPCLKRLNATKQFGCSTGPGGVDGALHYASTQQNLTWLFEQASNDPYIVALEFHLFNKSLYNRLVSSGKVSGIILLTKPNDNLDAITPEDRGMPSSLSWDASCPNTRFGLYGEDSCTQPSATVWNPLGTQMLFEELPIPIFGMSSQDDINQLLEQCYYKYNSLDSSGNERIGPYCAVQLVVYAWAGKDAGTCIRRSRTWKNQLFSITMNPREIILCDSMDGENVYATMKPIFKDNSTRPNRSVILLSARLDSATLFDSPVQSAESSISALIVFLSIVDALSEHRMLLRNASRDLLFVLFHGETFDYLGSNRFFGDMDGSWIPDDKKNIKEIKIENIDFALEISQIAKANVFDTSPVEPSTNQSTVYWLHSDPISRNQATSVVQDLQSYERDLATLADSMGLPANESMRVGFVPDTKQPLPPASIQTLLRRARDRNLAIPAFLIGDYQKAYRNNYYVSEADLAENIGYSAHCVSGSTPPSTVMQRRCANTVSRLTSLATVLARFLAKHAFNLSLTDSAPAFDLKSVKARHSTVSDLLKCFLVTRKCQTFISAITKEYHEVIDQSDAPLSQYVYSSSNYNPISAVLYNVIAKMLGDPLTLANWSMCDADKFSAPYNSYRYFRLWIFDNATQQNITCIRSLAYKVGTNNLGNNPPDDLSNFERPVWVQSALDAESPKFLIFLIPSRIYRYTLLSLSLLYTLLLFVFVYFLRNWFAARFAPYAGPASRSPASVPQPASTRPSAPSESQSSGAQAQRNPRVFEAPTPGSSNLSASAQVASTIKATGGNRTPLTPVEVDSDPIRNAPSVSAHGPQSNALGRENTVFA